MTEYLGDDEDIARRGGIGEEEEEDDLVIHHGREMTGGKLSERERLARGFELDNLGDDDERDGFKDEEDGAYIPKGLPGRPEYTILIYLYQLSPFALYSQPPSRLLTTLIPRLRLSSSDI